MDSYQIWTVIIKIFSILVTIGLAIAAIYIWKKRQQLLRKSSAAQFALRAQVAFRLKLEILSDQVVNLVLLSTSDSKSISRTRELVEIHQADLEARFILLIEALILFEKLCGEGDKDTITSYTLAYENISLVFAELIAKIGRPDLEDEPQGETLNKCIDLLKQIEAKSCIDEYVL